MITFTTVPATVPNMSKTNIIEIAARLGISKSTVSRALSGHPDINPGTRDKIAHTAKQMGYQPNFLARSLSTQQTKTIGVIVPHIRHTFFSEIFKGIDNIFHPAGYHIIIANSEEDEKRERENIQNLISRRVDGFMISVSAATKSNQVFKLIQQAEIPLVLFERHADVPWASHVVVDYKEGYILRIRHLLSTGCKRIAFILDNHKSYYSRERQEALEAAMKKLRMKPASPYMIPAASTIEGAMEAFSRVIKKGLRPDAVIGSSSQQAIGVIKVAEKLKINVPGQIQVMGNIITPFTEILRPKLSGIHISIENMGEQAAGLLLKQITDKSKKPVHSFIKPKLIIRESTK